MDRWIGRVALVTGASSGIGFGIAKDLVQQGMKVVGIARNISKIQELASELEGSKGSLVAMKCDLTKDQDIYDVFNFIKDTFGGVDVCINNAGLSYNNNLIDGTPEEWRSMLDVNVVAVCLCTKLSIASMKEREVDDGQIINISSDYGHIIPNIPEFHFYAGTKFAIKAITAGLRQELWLAKSHIRVSTISPGFVDTDFVMRMTKDENIVKGYYAAMKPLSPEDLSTAVIQVLSAPLHVQINDIFLTPTEQEC